MSTPLEKNTEELQEILQAVHDLPSPESGGSSPEIYMEENTLIIR